VKDKPRPHSKPRHRQLSPEEIELWLQVTQTVTARKEAYLPALASTEKPAPNGETGSEKAASSPDPDPKLLPPQAKVPASSKPPPLAPLERRVRQKLSRGQLAPEASIDLHGMGQHEAYTALQHFLKEAQSKGIKLVLVVTGKGERGNNPSSETGVLRRAVPLWLSESFYRMVVVGFEEAARPHGGAGALYVRIRRRDRSVKTPPK
jgi:DNA-nicking Smr family endonuclease